MSNQSWKLAVSPAQAKRIIEEIKVSCSTNRLILPEDHSPKLETALSSSYPLEKDEKPVVLYDDTVFGSGKDGFLITTKNVYLHKPFQDTEVVSIESIRGLMVAGGEVFFDTKSTCISLITSDVRNLFISYLRDLLIKSDESDGDNDDDDWEEDEDDECNEDNDEEEDDDFDDDDAIDEENDAYDKDEEDEEDDDGEYDNLLSRTFSPTFEGILYEKYGIGRGMAFDEAVEILEDDDWTISTFGSGLYVAKYLDTDSEIDKNMLKYLYSFPIMGMFLAEYNGELVGVGCMFAKQLKDSIISFFEDQVFNKYDFSKKYIETVGLTLYAPQQDVSGGSIFDKIEAKVGERQDYSRGIMFDDSDSVCFICYSFLHDSTFGPLWAELEDEWKKFLITDTDDDATIIFGDSYKPYYNQDSIKKDFFRLLKKWDDVLSREDEEIKIKLPNDEQDYHGKKDQVKLVYKNSLQFLFYKTNGVSHEEVRLELCYKKDQKSLEGDVSMHFGDSNESRFSKNAKLCLENLLLHLDEYDDEEEFSGEDMWMNLSRIINAELDRIKDKNEEENKKRKQENEKFEDDFDNL